jgi:hypothetical protein
MGLYPMALSLGIVKTRILSILAVIFLMTAGPLNSCQGLLFHYWYAKNLAFLQDLKQGWFFNFFAL